MIGERYISWDGPEPIRDSDREEVELWIRAGFEKAREVGQETVGASACRKRILRRFKGRIEGLPKGVLFQRTKSLLLCGYKVTKNPGRISLLMHLPVKGYNSLRVASGFVS
jgi:hypothetical protein